MSNQRTNKMNDDIIKSINRNLDEALKRGRRVLEDEGVLESVEEWKDKAEIIIRNHPVKTVAGGLVFGYILGKIFSSDD